MWRQVPYATCQTSLRGPFTDQLVIDPSVNDLKTPVSLLTSENPLHSLVQDLLSLLTCHDET